MKLNQVNQAIAAAIISGAFAAPATFAQDAQPVQRVEITGSNIKRLDVETSSPVQVITREEIKRTGASSIKELLDLQPSSTGGLSDVDGSNSFAAGASAASLRNLGKQSTLILLNFRRVSPFALADFNEVFSNIDALPLDAVERIEILKNGASAIYGSDAVAGVINIITRKDYRGFEAGGSYEESLTSRSFKKYTGSITGGFGDLAADGYNVLANVELYKRDNVIWRDVLQYMNPATFQFLPQTPSQQFSTFSYPGNVNFVPVEGCAQELIIDGLCRFDRYSRFEAIPAADRISALISGTVNLGERTQLFSELLWSRTETKYISPFQPYGPAIGSSTWGDPTTNSSRTFIPRGLPPEHPLNDTGAEADFRYRFTDSPAERKTTADDYRFLVGLRGGLGEFDWEAALGYMGSKVDDTDRGRFSDSGFKEVIGDYNVFRPDADGAPPADFFNKPNGYRIGQTNSPEVINRLFPSYGTVASTSQIFLDGKISGEIGKMSAGPVLLATGFDLRRERLRITPSDNLLIGDIVAVGNSSADSSRTFGAIFGEVSIPLAKTLEAQVAARIDKFPKFDAQISPKLGLRYQPSEALLLRATAETGFRAPNLTEAAESRKFSFDNGVVDPQRCPAALRYADDLTAQAANSPPDVAAVLLAQADNAVTNECSVGIPNITSENPDLKPEESKSYSLGIVLEPVKDVSFSLDYWNIKRKNEIGLRLSDELLAQENDPPPGTVISRLPLNQDTTFDAAAQAQYGVTVGPLSSITNLFENFAKTKTDGVDIGVASTFGTPIGKMTFGLNATYLINYRAFSETRNAYGYNLAGRYGYPRLKGSVTAALNTSGFTNGVRVRYSSSTSLVGDVADTEQGIWTTDGCRDNFGIPASECRVGASTLVDYFLSYEGIKNLTIGLNIENIFNEQPEADVRDLFDNGGFIIPTEAEDARRRTLRLTLSYKFL
jgi:iron complex outermembrane recepter protein